VDLLGNLDRVDSEKFTECNATIIFRKIKVHPNIEDLLAECVDVSYETIRFWWNQFGVSAARAEPYRESHRLRWPVGLRARASERG
jgi:hypothetical protein